MSQVSVLRHVCVVENLFIDSLSTVNTVKPMASVLYNNIDIKKYKKKKKLQIRRKN